MMTRKHCSPPARETRGLLPEAPEVKRRRFEVDGKGRRAVRGMRACGVWWGVRRVGVGCSRIREEDSEDRRCVSGL